MVRAHRHPLGRFGSAAIVALVAVLLLAVARPALAATTTGFDISFPQCGKTLPSKVNFAVVGVNDGIAYRQNRCLSAEYTWATNATATSTSVEPHVQFYANTGDPGFASSSHWPVTQTTPRDCAAAMSTNPPNGSPDCDYDYGWYAAQDSFNDAVGVAGSAATTAAPWWLDVESANSWNDGATNNVADIQGAVDFLHQAGVTQVGIYTNSYPWTTYMGGDTTTFRADPSWVPGSKTLKQAVKKCSTTVTGGPAYLSQYQSQGLDADYDCR